MLGQMMNMPLTTTSILQFAEKVYARSEIVSVTADNPLHRYTYADAFQRVRKLANALKKLGCEDGDVIGTLAWNDYRHLELYYAISCSGMVCHTVNPRLFPEQLQYIIDHAEDKFVFIDVMFVPLLEKLAPALPRVKGYIVLTDEAHMPTASTLPNLHCYETLIGKESTEFEWPTLDENQASALCYTSGTTGNPKGVLYSHRTTILHTYATAMPDVFGISVRDVVLPIVPMFHVNGWGLVYTCPMIGAKLVMPGPKMGDGETLCRLINEEKVTTSAGVPTVWLALLNYLDQNKLKVPTLKRVTTGGAACPQPIFDNFREKYGVEVHHAWGMTEMSPLGTYNTLKPHMLEWSEDEKTKVKLNQGRPAYGVEIKIVDDNNNELPWDGKSSGSVKVRGPWIIQRYFKAEADATDADGWFETGDVASMDPEGYMTITDRTKDVIKSGGEWISSIELENTAMLHPAVAEAAVIGVSHPKWTERPLLVVVPKAGSQPDKAELLQFFEGKVAKWWIPEACEFVTELPHTATGKISKKDLRTQFTDYLWPDA
ncbi:3-(methylthio)propionyl-CoA ligase [Simiduia agarivorans]|uniref:AMP-dependent synthetase and ligase n=1 Tax=Simiduia agarivorans (strain DSM 21679 / JCM 13881 / BCRC 17597 / SA1) TaxID=1117647 RepID=K4KGL7_SIMAS|nr:3-(methylthio)propionyl-CoA ligase [Simiduia agarivorans]AFU98136.2 AMP-dependent synthetase and ligase [Simiduia agarivorans SA1 = DSM 21679]